MKGHREGKRSKHDECYNTFNSGRLLRFRREEYGLKIEVKHG